MMNNKPVATTENKYVYFPEPYMTVKQMVVQIAKQPKWEHLKIDSIRRKVCRVCNAEVERGRLGKIKVKENGRFVTAYVDLNKVNPDSIVNAPAQTRIGHSTRTGVIAACTRDIESVYSTQTFIREFDRWGLSSFAKDVHARLEIAGASYNYVTVRYAVSNIRGEL